MKRLIPILLVAILWACAPQRAFYNQKVAGWEANLPDANAKLVQTVFLVGDAGKPSDKPLEPTLKLLQSQMKATGEQSATIFLGDNIYSRGLPDSTNEKRAIAEKYLKTQLNLLKDYQGKGFMIPGNHDWDRMGKNGWKYVQNEQAFVADYLGKENVFLPTGGCPGPVEVELSEGLVLLIIDTQWWLHQWDKPKGEDGCEIDSDADFLLELADAVKRHKGKKVIVAGHHPMFSNGLHGGHVKPTTHLFPLTDMKKNLYVPLPGLGSIYAFYRTVVGNVQDIPNPRYKELKKALTTIFDTHENLVYVAGHEHNLQYFKEGNSHYVVSGAGCKATYTTHRKKAQFAYGNKGFSRLNYYSNGDVWLEFWVPQSEGDKGEVVFRQKLMNHIYKPEIVDLDTINFAGQTVDAPATLVLGIKKNGGMLGENYRKEWKEVIKDVPVFDLGTRHGGLKIIKKGGGMQTKSLRLEAKNGKQYVLRSVEKFPENAVPDDLRGTIGEDVVKDQISASHPYGAFVVPKLADAAGVYHTNPELVWLPDDPRLGEYRDGFANGLYVFEERPDDDWSDADFFGNSEKIRSTISALEKLRKDNDDYVDQDFVVRSRLFDIWLGDWDRHDDQWRWASFEDEDGNDFYRPIPRDRDQTFFYSDGWLLRVASHKWGIPKFQGFHKEIRDIEGLGFNARYFDRSFITEPSKEVWLAMADSLKQALTDEVIEAAIKEFPPEIYQHHGDIIIEKLKQRREDLTKYAEAHYLFLAKTVSVVGSDKHERFKVERLNDDETRVRVWKMKKSGKKKQKIYDRTFLRKETKEIRLYGLGGNDDFRLEGTVKKGIKIRIIGGDGTDVMTDSSKVSGPGKKTVVYDLPTTKLETAGETRSRLSEDKNVNTYDRKDFKYDVTSPVLAFAYNPDDGVFIGGGVSFTKHGFRKAPYADRHTLKANVAPMTSSYNLLYKSEWRKKIGKWDLVLEGDFRVPSFTNFYYGLGNETQKDENEKQGFYRVRFSQLMLHPQLRKQSQDGVHTLSVGGFFQRIEIEDPDTDDPRFVKNDPISSVLIEEGQTFVAGTINYVADTRDNKTLPKKGLRFSLENSLVKGMDEDIENINFYQFKGDFSFYTTFGKFKKMTLAARVGGAINEGEYQFFQANTLGGFANLRGYNRMRFAGDKTFYQNTELRIKLFKFRSALFPGGFGIVAQNDFGRVWLAGEESDKWHHGYGGGIWIAPFDQLAMILDYTDSEEGGKLWLRFGFLF